MLRRQGKLPHATINRDQTIWTKFRAFRCRGMGKYIVQQLRFPHSIGIVNPLIDAVPDLKHLFRRDVQVAPLDNLAEFVWWSLAGLTAVRGK